MKKFTLLLMSLLLSGCSSSGTLGIVMKRTSDPGAMLRNAQTYKELGPVQGETCRYFLLAIAPWGDSAFSTAVDDALGKVGGDALINVTVSSGLYGYIPIYNVFSYTCTEVSGTAIKFEKK
ncbi:MAG TPA: hypothetical protein VK187_07180 [Geobacteraceae bacterium]|nr:hypothetical protein [Geobacteraceae bacterium]